MDALRVDGGGIPMEIQFVASVAPIVRDTEVARAFYGDALGLSFEGSDGEYVFTQKLDGTKLWALAAFGGGNCLLWDHGMAERDPGASGQHRVRSRRRRRCRQGAQDQRLPADSRRLH